MNRLALGFNRHAGMCSTFKLPLGYVLVRRKVKRHMATFCCARLHCNRNMV